MVGKRLGEVSIFFREGWRVFGEANERQEADRFPTGNEQEAVDADGLVHPDDVGRRRCSHLLDVEPRNEQRLSRFQDPTS